VHRAPHQVVVNAGGLNPAGLAAELEKLLVRLGITATIAHIDGDDCCRNSHVTTARSSCVLDKDIPLSLREQVVTANAPGAWGIVEALPRRDVVCPRVTDAA
jgi:hypothetical protein